MANQQSDEVDDSDTKPVTRLVVTNNNNTITLDGLYLEAMIARAKSMREACFVCHWLGQCSTFSVFHFLSERELIHSEEAFMERRGSLTESAAHELCSGGFYFVGPVYSPRTSFME